MENRINTTHRKRERKKKIETFTKILASQKITN